jgi:hypothetical protein
MSIRARERETNEAHSEMAKFVVDTVQRHNLTYLELLFCLAQIQMSWSSDGLKDERES